MQLNGPDAVATFPAAIFCLTNGGSGRKCFMHVDESIAAGELKKNTERESQTRCLVLWPLLYINMLNPFNSIQILVSYDEKFLQTRQTYFQERLFYFKIVG
jgi:hypothetical protein